MSDDRSTIDAAGEPGGIEILVSDSAWDADDAAAWVRRAAEAALGDVLSLPAGAPPLLLSIELAGDDRVAELNLRFRGKHGPTDVLSFPAHQRAEIVSLLAAAPAAFPILLGDIIMAHGVMSRDAALEGKTEAAHLAHLTVHGVLHCLGFDHQREDEAEIMEAAERRILARLGIADPYHRPEGETWAG